MSQDVGDELDKENLKTMHKRYYKTVGQSGRGELNEKTIYDVIERTNKAINNGETLSFEDLQSLAEATRDIEATKGRAAYFKEASKGHVDPGAQSSVYILNALIGAD